MAGRGRPGHNRGLRWVAAVVAVLVACAGLWAIPATRDLLSRVAVGVRPGVRLAGQPLGGMYRGEVHALLEGLQKSTYRPPVNAGVNQKTGKITPDRGGLILDVPATLQRVMDAGIRARVQPVYVPVAPRWTVQDILAMTHVAGRYTTYGYGGSGRWHNLALALRHINNILLYPGQTFSFMDAMPPFTKGNGWQDAPVIVDGDMQTGLGGGVCQVSSTLYNAARRAGMKILERHHHAKAVPYVPPGCDATVAEHPLLDLRFQNALDRPVLIRAWLAGGAVRTVIYSLPPNSPAAVGQAGIPAAQAG